MPLTTDPAREFTDLCQRIRNPENRPGGDVLAQHFDVKPWSTEFMLILACIHQRITALREMIDETELDPDIKQAAFDCLENIRNAFSLNGLANHWSHSTQNYLTDASLMPIRMASAYVRPSYGYTVPDNDELSEFLDTINLLLEWLRKHELVERDFIRTAIIEGLEGFAFRVERVGWFGWPDTMDSLKAVVAAYLALERGQPPENASPPYDAMLKKVGEGLSTIFERVKFVKEVNEMGDWLLKGYGALCASGLLHSHISGLLTHTN